MTMVSDHHREDRTEKWRRRIREDVFGNYHFEMAVAFQRNADIPGTIAALNRAIAADPWRADARVLLINLLRDMGDGPAADLHEQSADRVDPEWRVAALYADVATALAEDRLDTALNIFRSVQAATLSEWRRNTTVAVELAKALKARDHMGDACDVLQSALDTSPGDVFLMSTLSKLALQVGDKERAVVLAQQILALTPEDPEAAYNLGSTYLAIGDGAAARRFFEQARVRHYRHADQLDLSLCWSWLLSGHKTEALVAFEAAMAAHPSDMRIASHAALPLLSLGRVGDALARARLARASQSNHAHAMIVEALCLGMSGQETAGMDLLRSVMVMVPTMAWPRYVAAHIALSSGQTDGAAAAAREGQRLSMGWEAFFLGLLPDGGEKVRRSVILGDKDSGLES